MAYLPRALHIAILDDDPSIRTALVRLLKATEMVAQAYATSGELFESVARKCPDCLLLDLQMPEVSGLDVLKTLDEQHIRVPTIVITGSDAVDLRPTCLDAGAIACLKKPLDAEQLIRTIKKVCGLYQPDPVPSFTQTLPEEEMEQPRPCPRGGSLFFPARGQDDAEDRPVRLVDVDLKPPAMPLNDDLANGKSDTASGNLGRKKRVENAAAVLGCYSDAVVFHRDRDIGRARQNSGGDRQGTRAAGDVAHRLQAVGDQVPKQLMQLAAIAKHGWKFIVHGGFGVTR